jgi:hypothetical protein
MYNHNCHYHNHHYKIIKNLIEILLIHYFLYQRKRLNFEKTMYIHNLCDKCSIKNYLKQGDALSPLLFNFS